MHNMARPKEKKRIHFFPDLPEKGDIFIEHDEFEALRLVDFEGKTQEEAAKIMQTTQSTLSRLLKKGRKKVMTFLINKKSLGIKKEKLRGDKMKIAIATEIGGLEDRVSMVFGRAKTFTIVEIEGNEIKNVTVKGNPGFEIDRGAGISTAQFLVNEKVERVIAGNIGPNASNILTTAGIIFYSMPGVLVRDAIDKIIKGAEPTQQINMNFRGRGRCFGRGPGRGRRWI